MTYLEYIKRRSDSKMLFIKVCKYLFNLIVFYVINILIKVYIVNSKTKFTWIPIIVTLIAFVIYSTIHAIYYLYCKGYKYTNLGKHINHIVNALIDKKSLQKPKYGLAIGNVFTILQHPHLAIKRNDNLFLGWLDNNQLSFSFNKKLKNNTSLQINHKRKKELWVGTNCVDLDIPLVASKENALRFRVLVYNDNKLLTKQYCFVCTVSLVKSNIKENITKKIKTLLKKDGINVSKINVGIVSICEGLDGTNELIVLAKLSQDINKDNYLYDQAEGINKIVELIGDVNKDDYYRYALLLFSYLKCDSSFVYKLYEKTKSIKIKKADNNLGIDFKSLDINETNKPTVLDALRSAVFEKMYKSLYEVEDTLVFSLCTYIFTEIFFPLIADVPDFSLKAIFKAILNNVDSLIVPGIVIVFKMVVILFEKFFERSNQKLIISCMKDDYFKGVKVLNGLIKPFKGIRNDELHIIHITNDNNINSVNKKLLKYTNSKIENERNDGEKFRLIEYRNDDIVGDTYLWVDSCKYTDVERFKVLEEKYNNGQANELYSVFLNESNRVCSGESCINENMINIPPNSLCMHIIVLTCDGYVLFTRRNKNIAYSSNKYDFSIEEQLSRLDFDNDGVRIDLWLKRALKEEMGIDEISTGRKDYMDYKLQAVVREDQYLNFALMARVKLKITRKRLQDILNAWPRQDYEFNYGFCSIGEVCDFVEKGMHIKNIHATACFRLYLLLLELNRKKDADRIREVINNVVY